MQVLTRARMGQRCHNKPRWETGLQSAGDVMHRKHAEDFGDFEESRRVETRHADENGRLSLARRSQANLRAMGATRDRGQMIKTA